MGDQVVSSAFAGPDRPMNVPIVKEPLSIFDENTTFFPELVSNEQLRDAVHSSGYGQVVVTKEKMDARKREVEERVRAEENKDLTFKPNLNPTVSKNQEYERVVEKRKKELMKQVPSSGYSKKGSDAWLRKATDKAKKTSQAARPRPTVGPDGEPMFKPTLVKAKTAKTIRSEVPSSGYGRRMAAPKPKREKPPRPDFKPKTNVGVRARQLKKEAPSSQYGRKTAPFKIGYEERDGKIRQVTEQQVDKYNGMASRQQKLTARRRLSSSSLIEDPNPILPEEPDPQKVAREQGFVLDCVRVTNTCPLRSKYVEASDDPLGSVYVKPAPLPDLDETGQAMKESFVAAPSSGYGTRFAPDVARLQETGDGKQVWDPNQKKWIVVPRKGDGWEYDDENQEWVPVSSMDETGTLERPTFDVRGIGAKPKQAELDGWLTNNPKVEGKVGDVDALDDEDDEEAAARVGLGNICVAAKPLPKVPKGYYATMVKVGESKSSGYGKRVPGWEYDEAEGGMVAVGKVQTESGDVRKVRIEKKMPPSVSDPVIQQLHGGNSFFTGAPAREKIGDEPAEKEIAWREGSRRNNLKNEVGSHGYGVVFPEVKARPESPIRPPAWKPPSNKPDIPEPEQTETTPLARNAVSHYGPGYDPAAALHYDDMYEDEDEEEESEEGSDEGEEGEEDEESEGSEA